MSEPSKEAVERAIKLYKRPSEQPGNIARALQELMDARDAYKAALDSAANEDLLLLKRSEAAEARVTELQATGTQLLLENRQLKERNAELEQLVPGPRQKLWLTCSSCGMRAPDLADIRHRHDCTAVGRNGNGGHG